MSHSDSQSEAEETDVLSLDPDSPFRQDAETLLNALPAGEGYQVTREDEYLLILESPRGILVYIYPGDQYLTDHEAALAKTLADRLEPQGGWASAVFGGLSGEADWGRVNIWTSNPVALRQQLADLPLTYGGPEGFGDFDGDGKPISTMHRFRLAQGQIPTAPGSTSD